MITLMNGLNQTRFSSSIVAALGGGPLESLIAPQTPRHIIGAGNFIKSLPALYHILRKERPDAVISSMAPMNFTLLLLRPFFPRIQFIVREATLPSYILSVYPHFKFIMSYAYKYLYAKSAAVIAPSRVVLNELLMLGIDKKCINLLYNPVQQMDTQTAITRSELGVPPERILFVASGRLNKQKGFDRLIDILPHLKTDWHLIILGEGEERTTIERSIESNKLLDRVTLVGHQNAPWRFYKTADCLVLPSRVEGLPNVVLESLACGTPVIAIKEAGGVHDIAAQAHGHVVVTDTMEDFVGAMNGTTSKKCGESLLPDIFMEKNVQAQFTTLLESLLTTPR